MIKRIKIEKYQRGILFCEGEVSKILNQGSYQFLNPFKKETLLVYSELDPWLNTEKLDIIVKSGLAADALEIIDLKDTERALVWIDNRFSRILIPGVYALWKTERAIRVQIVDTVNSIFEHSDINAILKSAGAEDLLNVFSVGEGYEGLFFLNGKLERKLAPGRYVFWKNSGQVKLYNKDMREITLDINGQEIMTKDNVTLRINALLSYRITDSLKAVLFSEDISGSLYRGAQLALRAVIGSQELDDFISRKDGAETELLTMMKQVASRMGIEVVSFGIRDTILPGEMKELLNKVTEAKKVAEANLISRREEVAAMRSQVNTAKILESNPGLMRLKELEVLEKISENSKLNVILGNEKLSEKVVNLL